ncbi:MAG: hypothetical protein NDI61_01430 [Bdellovibrionaceae bacterium]|nr:hypothetical protein [Pseudobdellovibrionaceae bacterium]
MGNANFRREKSAKIQDFSGVRTYVIFSVGGFSFVEVVVTTALLLTFITASLTFSGWALDSVKAESSRADRNVENIEMLKLLTQPVYFGALSKFDVNAQLARCMNTDGVECDSKKEYPVTAFDLKTNQVLSKVSSSVAGGVKSKIAFKVHCPNRATTCDKADFYTVIVTTSVVSASGASGSPAVKMGMVAPEFSNVATFVPDASVAPGRPINILLYLDTSHSMVSAQGQIKAALENLVKKLGTMNAKIGLYNMSGYSQLPVYYYYDSNGTKISPTPSPMPGSFTYYVTEYFRPQFGVIYNGQDPAWILSTNPAFTMYNFRPTDTQAVRDKTLAAMKAKIDASFLAGTEEPFDTPFCGVLRMMDSQFSQTYFSLDSVTPTVVLVLANEDEESSDVTCQRSRTLTMTTNPDSYSYTGKRQTLTLNVRMNVIKDGVPAIVEKTFVYDQLPYDPSLVADGDCMAKVATIPSNTLETWLVSQMQSGASKYYAGAGYTVLSCKTSTIIPVWFKQTSTERLNICSELDGTRNYTVNGYTFKAPANYIDGSCNETFVKGGALGSGYESGKETYIPTGSSSVSLALQALKSRVSPENLYFIPIIHPNATACPMTTGSAVGTKYLQLADGLGDGHSTVIPVCSPDYTQPLAQFEQWTASLGINDMVLPSTVASHFSGIALVRSGVEIPLTKNVEYSLSGNVVIFKTGTVQPNDVIKIYLN